MMTCPYSAEREKLVADALKPVASEMRLIDAADLIALLRFERHADLADLVSSAAELYFMPGTVTLSGGEYTLEWSGNPLIVLDLEMHLDAATAYLRMNLQDETCGIELVHVAFDDPSTDPALDTSRLSDKLRACSYRAASQHRMDAIDRSRPRDARMGGADA